MWYLIVSIPDLCPISYISILLKLALTVVMGVLCDVNCVKCNKMYGSMHHFSQATHLSPQSESKDKNNECLFSTPSIL